MESHIEQISVDVPAERNDVTHDTAFHGLRRQTRRLSDKVLIAFHQACDMFELEIARHLLQLVEVMLTRPSTHISGSHRRNAEGLVAAHERLWHLQHPSADQ